MLRKPLFVIFILGLSISAVVAADEPDLSKLQTALGGATPDSVKPMPVAGLYEVVVGGQLLYLSEDGQFAIQGDVVDLSTSRNLTEMRRSELRVAAVEAIGDNNMVVFAPSEQTKHTITIFTDIDCGYCRKLHREIAMYNDNGISVRYLMFPRAGIGSESYNKAVTVWCSDDRKDAMTRAKRGEDIGQKSCSNPVNDHYQLGQDLGVRGTPSIVLENGQMLPGYVPADKLAQMLVGVSSSN